MLRQRASGTAAAAIALRRISSYGAGGGSMAPSTASNSGGAGRERAGRSHTREQAAFVRAVCAAEAKQRPALGPAAAAALVETERVFGCRVVSLASLLLDAPLVRALRLELLRLEANPAVTIVVLRGSREACFSGGSDVRALASLAADAATGAASVPARRASALRLLQEQCELQLLVATFAKPVVVAMHGTTCGSAWALAQHAQYSYGADDVELALPECGAGLVPHGGASFHLARMGGGVGLWMALTGATLAGVDAYWAGAAQLFGSKRDLRELLPREAGAASGDENSALDLQTDATYARALRTLRDFRADGKLGWVTGNLGEDVSRELFDEYVRLKRWYAFWVAGDRSSAEIARSEDRLVGEEAGDLFDYHESQELHGGRGLGAGYGEDHPGSYAREPRAAAAERRARIGALSAHAAAVFRGTSAGSDLFVGRLSDIEGEAGPGAGLGTGPSAELALRLQLIRRCFGGISGTGEASETRVSGLVAAIATGRASALGAKAAESEPARIGVGARRGVASTPPQAVTSQSVTAPQPLPRDWEARLLAVPVDSHVAAARAHCELDREDLNFNPSLSSSGLAAHGQGVIAAEASAAALRLRLSLLADAVRSAVPLAWPTGRLADDKVRGLIERFFGMPPATANAEAASSDAARDAAEAPHREAALLLRLAAARCVADLLRLAPGLGPYALADPSLVTAARRLYRRPSLYLSNSSPGVGATNVPAGRTAAVAAALAPWVAGPSGFTVPAVEDGMSVGEVGLGPVHAPGGVVPANPRVVSDPDGLFYDFREDDDAWWPFTRGRWRGDFALAGSGDALPIAPLLAAPSVASTATPDSLLGPRFHAQAALAAEAALRPAPSSFADSAAAAVGALRVEALRLLFVGDGSSNGSGSGNAGAEAAAAAAAPALAAYTGEAARVALVFARAASGDAAAAGAVAALRQAALGRPGLRAVASRVEQLRRAEGGGGDAAVGASFSASTAPFGSDAESAGLGTSLGIGGEFDVTAPGDQLRRASTYVAWPRLAAALRSMRLLVYRGLAQHAFGLAPVVPGLAEAETALCPARAGGPSDAELAALAAVGPDTAWGLAELTAATSHAVAADGAASAVAAMPAPASVEAVTAAAAASAVAAAASESPAAALQSRRLLNAWLSMQQACQPGADGMGSASFRRGPPQVLLTAAQRTELSRLALEFARLEGVALGPAAGGLWLQGRQEATGEPTYAIAATRDDESGLLRVTLVRSDAFASAPIANAASTAVAALSSRQQRGPVFQAPLHVDEVRRRLAPLVFWGEGQGTGPQEAQSQAQSQAQAQAQQQRVARELAATGSADLPLSTSASSGLSQFRNLGTGRAGGSERAGASSGAGTATSAGASAGTGAGTGGVSVSSETRAAARRRLAYPAPDAPPIASEAESAAELRAAGSAWDYTAVLAALSDLSGCGAVALFGLPRTGNTLAAGALAVAHFRAEADGRVPLPQPASVAEVRQRLQELLAESAAEPATPEAAASARFARETLGQLDAAAACSSTALEATLALVSAAGRLPLESCMALEFRVLSRLLEGAGAAPGESVGNLATAAQRLLAPLDDPRLELQLGARVAAAAALSRRRAREQSAWERSLEAYLAGGEGAGAFGDLFRRRYAYFKAPLGGLPFGDVSEDVQADDEREAEREGAPPAAEVADDVLRASGGSTGGGGSRSTQRFGAPSAREQDETSESESLALHVALERSLLREERRARAGAEGAALLRARQAAAAALGASEGPNFALDAREEAEYGALKVPRFLQ